MDIFVPISDEFRRERRIFMGNTHFPQKHPHTHKFCTAKTRILENEKIVE